MNVIIVAPRGIVGGAEKVALNSAIALAKSSSVQKVIYFSAVPLNQQEQGIASKAGVILHDLGQEDILKDKNHLRAALRGIWNFKAAKEMSTLLDEFSPEDTLVHFHHWDNTISSAPIRAVWRNGFKAVGTLHYYSVICPNGFFFNFPEMRICRLPPMSLGCIFNHCDPRSYKQKFWRLVRQWVKNYWAGIPGKLSALITISDFSEKILAPYLPPEVPRFRVSNPIDCDEVTEPVDVLNNEIFLFVGRLVKEKGVRLFCNAVTEAGVQGVVAGDGPERVPLQKEFPEISWLGWRSPEEIKKIMSQARALIFPSLWYEVSPLTTLEAAALGIPSIISDACAAQEGMEDEVSGLLFQSENVMDLVRQIKRMTDPTFAKKLSQSTFCAFWNAPPTMARHADELLKVYKSLL